MIKSVWGFDFIHPLLRSIWLQVYQEPSSTQWVKEIFRWHAKDFTINKIQTSKQPFPQQTQRRHQTHKKGNQATHCHWQNNELLQTRTINIQQSTRTKYHTVPQKSTTLYHMSHPFRKQKHHKETGHWWQDGHHSTMTKFVSPVYNWCQIYSSKPYQLWDNWESHYCI